MDYGLRPDGSKKGSGFLGELRRPDGNVMTEYSIGVQLDGKEIDIPTLVPTLTESEVNTLLNIGESDKIPDSIVKKATEHARSRIASGKSVFADNSESPALLPQPAEREDRKNSGVFGRTYDDFRNSQGSDGIRGPDDLEAGAGELAATAFNFTRREGISTSSRRARESYVSERMQAFEKLTGRSAQHLNALELTPPDRRARYEQLIDAGEIQRNERGELVPSRIAAGWFSQNPQAFQAIMDLRDLSKSHPGALLTDEQITAKISADFAAKRAADASVFARGRGFAAGAAEFAGTAAGAVTDPLVFSTLPLGAGAFVGKGIAVNALKGFASEAAIAGAVEIPIQAEVFRFKEQIGSPYSVKEAAFNVLAAAVGAGVIRAGGSITIDVAEKMLGKYRADAKSGTAKPTAESERAAKALDMYIREKKEQPWPDADPEAGRDHDAAIAKAMDDIADGRTPDVQSIVGDRVSSADPARNIPAGRMFTVDDIETFNPMELALDAETFQFKTGGDAAGVTTAFRDLNRFELQQAGQVIVYENKAGKLFIVDGHQRMGIARRALEAGQDPATVGLFGFRLREADGVTPQEARALAAVKNIAEGSGSAIDAAKVIRELGDVGMARMPSLPSAGAVARQGRELAKLSDEAFMSVVNRVIPERYGAIVGEVIGRDSRKQMAAIQILARTDPSNEVQARQIVRDVNATELEESTTLDLFGEQVVTESLVLERAKVIDSAIKRIRAEKSTFKTLVAREGAIQGKGANKLDRATNERIVQENEQVIQALERQANTRGIVSERLSEAARQLKSGGKPETVVGDFLRDIGTALNRTDTARIGDGGARPGGAAEVTAPVKPTLEEVLVGKAPEPLRGKVHRGKTPKGTDPLLRETDTINTPERVAMRERLRDELTAKGETVEGRKPIVYLMAGGGASGKGTLLGRLRDEGKIPREGIIHVDPDEIKKEIQEFKDLVAKGDSRAAAVVHEESSDIAGAAIGAGIGMRSDLIIDKTLGDQTKALDLIADLKENGYEIRLFGVTTDVETALVRAWKRAVKENRWVPEDHLITAHAGFAKGWERYADAVDEAELFDSTIDGRFDSIAYKEPGKDLDIKDRLSYDELEKRSQIDGKRAIENAKQKARAENQQAPGAGLSDGVVRDNGGGAPEVREGAAPNPGSVPGGRLDARRDPFPARINMGIAGSFEATPIPSVLYRDTNAEGLHSVFADSFDNSEVTSSKIFATDNPDLAIGQGANKGILIQFRENALSGREHIKPGTAIPGVGKEYVVNAIGKDSIDKVTIPHSVQLRGIIKARLKQYFDASNGKNETIYTRKGITEDSATMSGATDNIQPPSKTAPAKAIPQTDPISQIRNDADLFSENQLADDLAAAEDILRDFDVDLPERVIVEDGEELLDSRPAREILDELDREELAISDLFGCHIGAANA